MLKNAFWEGPGLHLGGVWDCLGPLLGTLGRFLAVFWAFKIKLFKALVQDRLQEAFWIDFGWILDGSGRVWERFWKGLGDGLGHFWKDFGKVLVPRFSKVWEGPRLIF